MPSVPAMGSVSSRLSPLIFAWLMWVPVALMRAGHLTESDTFWQIRTGTITLEDRSILTSDPFSWTAYGEPWIQNSWGFNVVLAIAHHVGGLPAVGLMVAGLILAIAAIVVIAGRRFGAHPVTLALFLFAFSAPLLPYLQARPQLVDYVAMLLMVLILRECLELTDEPKWSLLALFTVSVVWVNLHATTLLGVAVTVAASIAVLLKPTPRASRSAPLAAIAATSLGTVLNPEGLGLVTQSLSVKEDSASLIIEWQPLDITDFSQALLFFAGLAGLAVAMKRREVVFAAALTVLVTGSIVAMRILPLLAITALPLIASVQPPNRLTRWAAPRAGMLRHGAVIFVVAWTATAIPGLFHLGQPSPSSYSPAVVREIPLGCRVFNSYVLGGYIILERPDVLVSLDSRNDVYGSERVRTFESAVRGLGDLKGVLTGADCVLVPSDAGIVQYLEETPGWRQKTADEVLSLYVRSEELG